MFDFERPLLDRFGADFFRAIPARPGIYLFIGPRGRVLYVGQSKNLRQRLSYYKNARPEREPRKIIRLVHQTRRISIMRCDTPEAAQLREIDCIWDKRPRFNTALAAGRSYSFFGLSGGGGNLDLRLSFTPDLPNSRTFGAFKNRGLCRRAFLSLGRVLWSEIKRPASAYDLPLWLHERTRSHAWSIASLGPAFEEVEGLLAGESIAIANRAERLIFEAGDSLLRRIFENDLLVLAEFALLAQRMKALREFAGNPELLPQRAIEPAQFRWRFQARAAMPRGWNEISSENGLRGAPPTQDLPAR